MFATATERGGAPTELRNVDKKGRNVKAEMVGRKRCNG
jgi:hypothetical protein